VSFLASRDNQYVKRFLFLDVFLAVFLGEGILLLKVLVLALWALSPEVKRPECETDPSLSSSAEFKESWTYKSIPPYPSWHSV
jgi:hypothetical protein